MRRADGVGGQVATLRRLRGLTQRQLAARAHVSHSLLTKVECGQLPASPAFVAAVARALRVEITQLTGQPYRGRTASSDRVHEAVPLVRRELLAYALSPGDEDPSPRPFVELKAAVAEVSALRHRSDYLRLGALLPGVLADLRVAAFACEGHDRERVYGLLAESYAATGLLVWHLGYTDLWSITVDRYQWAAARSNDPLALCVAEYQRSGDLLVAGDFSGARRALDPAFARLEPDLGHASEPTLSIWGSLHLKAALVAARGGDADATWGHHSEARAVAEQLGADRDDYRLCFGPTNVGIWSVGLAAELCDDTRAIMNAQQLHIPRTAPRERVAHHYIDLARAFFWHGDPRRSLNSLHTARKTAPQLTRYHPMVRETVVALASARRGTDDLAPFASWLGLD